MFLKSTGASSGTFATQVLRAQSMLLLPNTAIICVSSLHPKHSRPQGLYVTAPSLGSGSGKIRDPGNEVLSSMPALLDA